MTPSPPQPRRRSPIAMLSLVHLVVLLFAFLMAEYIGEETWFTTLMAYAPPVFYLAAIPILVLLSLIFRDGRSLLVNGTALAFGVIVVLGPGKGYLPASIPADAPRLRVMTYNILHGQRGNDRIAAFIRRENPDIICFQEATPFYEFADPLRELEPLLPGYRFTRATDSAIATRLPVRATRIHPMVSGYSNRAAAEMEIEFQGKIVHVFSAHLATAARPGWLMSKGTSLPAYVRHTAEVRQQQTSRLLAATRRVTAPMIVCGDFNTPPRGVLYRRLTTEFTDAFAARGNGFGWTYPAHRPLLRIDYIFTAKGAVPVTAYVPVDQTSDHRAVVADIAVP